MLRGWFRDPPPPLWWAGEEKGDGRGGVTDDFSPPRELGFAMPLICRTREGLTIMIFILCVSASLTL